jgi:hypothetical protein
MLISEFIVGLWFVPVVVFIAIPLTVLCAWSVHWLLRKAFDKVEQTASSARAKRQARAPSFRPRPAV